MTFSDLKVVIFDCDGVMFNTNRANEAYYNQILQHFGRPLLTREQFKYCHMHTGDEAMRYLFEDTQLAAAAQDYRMQMGYSRFIRLMEIEPHLKPLITSLRPGIKTAVGTNRADTMEEVMHVHGLEDFFDLVVTSRDVPTPKPAPDILNRVLTHFDLAPGQALYIGDSVVDEQAAAAAGIPFVACGDPALEAAHHIESLEEMFALVRP
ncbi:MAG: HAD-IA family hydrolase [Desulfobacterales bacterium]|nr:HAD-IA family hydrolase [Desulfobacterales bacterium]MDJ0887850.1 HAD-IA family hydrolase [Desulfobacterales bacterium]